MKKIFALFALSMAFLSMTGCSNTDNKAYQDLNKQLENVEEVVSSTTASEVSSVGRAYYTSSPDKIDSYKMLSYQNMSREQNLREEVLSLNGFIKSSMKSDLKLSRPQLNAVKRLTSDIEANTKSLKQSKSAIKSNVNAIKKNLKSSSSAPATESEYVSLNNNLNKRYVYMTNIYNSLDKLCEIVCDENAFNENYSQEKETRIENSQDTEEENTTLFKKNIDSYVNSGYKREREHENQTDSRNYNAPITQNNYPPVYNGYGGYNAGFPMYNGNPYYNGYNGFGGYGGYGGYGNYGGYGYGMNGRYFMGRNTDTFYPYYRNTDTYKLAPNTLNGNVVTVSNENEVETNNDKDNDNVKQEDIYCEEYEDNCTNCEECEEKIAT